MAAAEKAMEDISNILHQFFEGEMPSSTVLPAISRIVGSYDEELAVESRKWDRALETLGDGTR